MVNVLTDAQGDLNQYNNLRWDELRWPNFTRAELSCRHCGEYYHYPVFLDALQALRRDINSPLNILSAHRCALHNAAVGGAPLSQHLTLAVDISLRGHNRRKLVSGAKASGFSGFGYYFTFLHLDMGRRRHWFGSRKAKDLWQTFLD